MALLRYFGEVYSDEDGTPLTQCGACDNCLTPREEVDATEIAQKILSCVLRINKHSGFSVGLAHIAEVLTGAANEKVKKWGHDTLSVYAIGKGRPKAEWLYYGRELISAGLLEVNHERFNVIEVTSKGLSTLKEKAQVMLKAPLVTSRLSSDKKAQQRKSLGAIDFDTAIFEKLRMWRMRIARTKGLPAYMIFSDATLQAIAARNPSSLRALEGISGIGEKKLSLYGEEVLQVLGE
jgi:ATP-dependent DNA helicase RecQ